MRKTLLSIAFALFGAMAVNAQYVSDPTENTKVTESIDNYGNDAVVSKDGILYSVQQVPNHDDDGTIRLAYNLQILDKTATGCFLTAVLQYAMKRIFHTPLSTMFCMPTMTATAL